MQQIYHSNSKTNIHIRKEIKNNQDLTVKQLAQHFNVSLQTIRKWRRAESPLDRSSIPKTINYALSEEEKALAISLRSATWFSLDEVWEMLMEKNSSISRSSISRCFKRAGINKVPQEHREKCKKFKEYAPGYLHMDVTYLPKFNGRKSYLYVAIDRATRAMFYWIYNSKTADDTVDFMDKVINFYPFKITHILTDNGGEFTNRLYRSMKGNKATLAPKMDVECALHNIDHRLTEPASPKTNGMVERVNKTIKDNTILKKNYTTRNQMNEDLFQFMCNYNLYRRHGSLRKELNVKTPLQAIYKWYDLEPDIFITQPIIFENKLLNLRNKIKQL